MAPPWTFDPELLKQLVQAHPEWSNPQLADALTADNNSAEAGPDRRGVVVDPARVASAKNRLKERWAAEGVCVRPLRHRSELVARLVHNTGVQIPDERNKQDHVYIRHLRVLDRIRERLPIASGRDLALRFERDLRRDRMVVDLHPDGTPFLRAAAPWELDSQNRLLDLVAAYRPREQQHAV